MINIGIIGAGRIGRVHAQTIVNLVPNARLVAIADRSPNDYKRAWAAEMGIDHISDNYRDILDREDIDAVFICTSTDTHTQYSLEAIERGKHVFCEKPTFWAEPADGELMTPSFLDHMVLWSPQPRRAAILSPMT